MRPRNLELASQYDNNFNLGTTRYTLKNRHRSSTAIHPSWQYFFYIMQLFGFILAKIRSVQLFYFFLIVPKTACSLVNNVYFMTLMDFFNEGHF